MTLNFLKQALKRTLYIFGYEVHKITRKSEPKISLLESESCSWASINPLGGQVKLHFGCGPRVLKGWINIDLKYEHFANYMQYYTEEFYPLEIRGGPSDFIEFDVTKHPMPLLDNSVDVVFHEDFIEHVSQKSQVLFLAETCRVLKPDAIHRVNTPNLLISMRDHADFSHGYEGVYVAESDKHGHLNVLTPKILKEMALMVGYSKVVFTARDQSASELIPREYRPDPNDRT
jgi:predicted SAM-dependent methyltransferase